MECYEVKFPNGKLILPESIDDGVFEKITVEFEDVGEVFPVREIEIFWSSCGVEMVQLFEGLLNLPVGQLWERFSKYVGVIMLTSKDYRIRFTKFTFSNSFLFSDTTVSWEQKIGDMKIRGTSKNTIPHDYEHVLSYIDAKSNELKEKVLRSHYDYKKFKELKENPDEKFDEYVARIIRLWEILLQNQSLEDTIVKMNMLGLLENSRNDDSNVLATNSCEKERLFIL